MNFSYYQDLGTVQPKFVYTKVNATHVILHSCRLLHFRNEWVIAEITERVCLWGLSDIFVHHPKNSHIPHLLCMASDQTGLSRPMALSMYFDESFILSVAIFWATGEFWALGVGRWTARPRPCLKELTGSIFLPREWPECSFCRSWVGNPKIMIASVIPSPLSVSHSGNGDRQSNRRLGLPFLLAQGTAEMVLGPRFHGGEAWESKLILVWAPWGYLVGMMQP